MALFSESIYYYNFPLTLFSFVSRELIKYHRSKDVTEEGNVATVLSFVCGKASHIYKFHL